MSNWADVLGLHHALLADHARTESYRRAILETVRTGDIVLDLGAGTGVLSFFACQAGARRVYAVEAGDIIELARQVSIKNGFQDRVVLVHERSDRVELPEKVDVIVSDPDVSMLGAILDARRRLLDEDGRIIPRAVSLFLVPVELPALYARIDSWPADLHGLDFSPLRRVAANNRYQARLGKEAFLGEPERSARIAFSEATTEDVRGEGAFVVRRTGLLHGIGGWFATEMAERQCFADPCRPEWGHTFFPLERAVPVQPGDRVIAAVCSANRGRVWRWRGRVDASPSGRADEVESKAEFDHSTLGGLPLSREALRRLASTYAPKLSRKGESECFLLGLLDGRRTLDELEGELIRRYPDVFRSQREASAFVRKVAGRCT